MNAQDQLEPTVFIIFGGAGDLTFRKLVPALFGLFQDQSMPASFGIIAVDRVDMSDDKLRHRLHDGVNQFSRRGVVKAAPWAAVADQVCYQRGDFKQLKTYQALGERCAELERQWGAKAHRIFYMATPPSLFPEIPKGLSDRPGGRPRMDADRGGEADRL